MKKVCIPKFAVVNRVLFGLSLGLVMSSLPLVASAAGFSLYPKISDQHGMQAMEELADVDLANLDEFEIMALKMRHYNQAVENGEILEPLKTQQYDVCEPGVLNCAQEINPNHDLATYNSTLSDPFYGYKVFLLVDKSVSQAPGSARNSGVRQPQTMHVYVREGNTLRLSSVHAVSTGREPTPGRSDTREGYMRVQNAQAKYTSRKYGELMPFSLWFESEYGTAIHQTRPDWCRAAIGARASAGCIRLCPGEAKPLFDLVTSHSSRSPIVLLDKRTGVPVERQGSYDGQADNFRGVPKVISGYPTFVRIINGNTQSKVNEIEAILKDPTQGFSRYFPARQRLGNKPNSI